MPLCCCEQPNASLVPNYCCGGLSDRGGGGWCCIQAYREKVRLNQVRQLAADIMDAHLRFAEVVKVCLNLVLYLRVRLAVNFAPQCVRALDRMW